MGLRQLVFNHFRFPVSPVEFARRHRRGLRRLGEFGPVKLITRPVMAANTFSCIPVGESVRVPPGTAPPVSIVESFIARASRRVIIDHCFCRNSSGCSGHDPGIGCLFLGEGTRQLDPAIGREASEEEALSHLRRAVDDGLVPCVGQAWVDARAFGVKDYRHFMTVCFCCDCCCLVGVLPHVPSEAMKIVVKLEGVSVSIGDDCDGCGRCLDVCIFSQLRLAGGRAVMGDDCKACGRCAAACPLGAINVNLEDPACVDLCLERIGARVDVGDGSDGSHG
jgi:UDP-glucose 4-epimerase